MDLHSSLTTITIAGFITSAIGAVGTHLWKRSKGAARDSVGVSAGQRFAIGVAIAGLLGSVASELLRVSIRHDDEARGRAEAIQKKALQDQERRWRSEMGQMLASARHDIEKNVKDTIDGFQNTQTAFQKTQTQLLDSKQSLLASSVQQMHTIIVASQPLTSIVLRWSFTSQDTQLWTLMKDGQAAIQDNIETTQGGFPIVPRDLAEYDAALAPLLTWLATRPLEGAAAEVRDSPAAASRHSIAVLIPLDEAPNAILPLGYVPYQDPDARGGIPKSAGILIDSNVGSDYSTAHVTAALSKSDPRGRSTYTVTWEVDPLTFAAAVDKANDAVVPTARLPSHLKVVILNGFEQLRLGDGHLSRTEATNLWHNEARNHHRLASDSVRNTRLTVEVNGFREGTYSYALDQMYALDLIGQYDDDLEVGCAVLEFVST